MREEDKLALWTSKYKTLITNAYTIKITYHAFLGTWYPLEEWGLRLRRRRGPSCRLQAASCCVVLSFVIFSVSNCELWKLWYRSYSKLNYLRSNWIDWGCWREKGGDSTFHVCEERLVLSQEVKLCMWPLGWERLWRRLESLFWFARCVLNNVRLPKEIRPAG